MIERPWGDLDFLGWRDPHRRSGLSGRESGGRLMGGDAARVADSQAAAAPLCASLCLIPAGGVSLMTAAKAGRSGQHGNSVGTYLRRSLAPICAAKSPGPQR